MKLCYFALPLALLLATGNLRSQTPMLPVRVMTYNVLEFGEGEDPVRTAAISTVIDSTMPDILCAQEIQGPEGYFAFHSTITGPKGYMSTGFMDGPDDNDDEVFYRASTVEWLASSEIEIEPRPAHVYTMHVLGTTDTIDVVVVHLQEGNTLDDVQARTDACVQIRSVLDTMPMGHHRIVAGSLNMYSSNEPGYLALLIIGIAGSGEVVDPISRQGEWSADSTFADIHTHSTRTTSLGDGGATGGMNHRFDQILISPSLTTNAGQVNYRTVGQDGQHFNKALTNGANGVVSAELAQALYTASDHLPVVVELEFFETSGVEEEITGGKAMNLTER